MRNYLKRLILISLIISFILSGCSLSGDASNSLTNSASQKTLTTQSSETMLPSASTLPTPLPQEKISVGDEYFQFYDGKVYYTDNKYLYVMSEDGTGGKRIAQLFNEEDDPYIDVWRHIHIYNDKIYYVNESETKLYSIDLDGQNKTELCDNAFDIKDIAELHIIYYGYTNDSNGLFLMNLDGLDKHVVDDDIGNGIKCVVKDGWLYYNCMRTDIGIRRCRLDGSDLQNYTVGLSVDDFIFENNMLYYCTDSELRCKDLQIGAETLLADINNPEFSEMFEEAFHYKKPYPEFDQMSLAVEGIKDGYIYFTWNFWADGWSGCNMLYKKKINESSPAELITSLKHEKGHIFDIDWDKERIYYYAAYNAPNWASLPKEWGVKRTKPLFYRIDFDGTDYLRINEKDMNQFVCFTFGDYTYFTAWDKNNLKLYRFNNVNNQTEELESEPVYLGESEGE